MAAVRARRRTLLSIAGVAVASLTVGLVAGQFIRSPADALSSAEAPEASVITVPVEQRVLDSEIRTRGDAAFAGSVEVELELGGLDTAPVVTGHVPERGEQLSEGDPLLEVVGRPVLALEGELPMYRSLSPGTSGPDVEQLKETLRRLDLHPGGEDDRYTAATSWAVAELFRRAGYEPPAPDRAAAAELASAQQAVEAAEDELTGAEAALQVAEDAADEAPPGPDAPGPGEARTRVGRAEEALEEAKQQLSEAQFRAGTPLPAAQVYYLPTLPRHVDAIHVSRGDLAQGTVMSVSGARLQITTGELSEADRALVAEGMDAVLELPTGDRVGTVAEVGSAVVIDPPELSGDEVDVLLEQGNILVVIPVASTDGEVLAVPQAALTTGAGDETRVEVWRDGTAELVEVEVGLVTQGYAEVEAVDGAFSAGDEVVVGQAAAEPDESDIGSGDDQPGGA